MTTLITFLLKLPASVRTVDVLGSWDSFREAYPLEKDRQAGPGHWRGCHCFKNITCDGFRLDPTVRRNGALKMGGTYWYFYRLNGEIEHHDPIEPSTTACPLLPGQEVNILEVPTEPPRCLGENWETNVFTLDPNAKYRPSKPPVRQKPTPLPSDTPSADSTRAILPVLERQEPPVVASATPPTATLQPPDNEAPKTSQGLCFPFTSSSSLMAKIFKLRGSKSAPEIGGKSGLKRGPFKSFWRRSTEDEESRQCYRQTPNTPKESQSEIALKTPHCDSSEQPPAVNQAAYVAPWVAGSTTDHVPAGCPSHSIAGQTTMGSTIESASQVLHTDVLDDTAMQRSSTIAKTRSPTPSPTSVNNGLGVQTIFGAPTTACIAANSVDMAIPRREDLGEANMSRPKNLTRSSTGSIRESSPFALPIQTNTPRIGLLEGEKSRASSVTRVAAFTGRPPSLLHDNRETLESFYLASPTLDGQISPHYLSQPGSPSVRDFDEAWEPDSPSWLASQSAPFESPPLLGKPTFGVGFDSLPMPPLSGRSGFQGYSLPPEEHASDLTLRKLPSSQRQPSPSSHSHRLVQSWNDGSSQQHLAALDELVDDLGHLGQIIV
ncbi:hypothetical protein XPA_000614 [Xanthoria parietina]